MSFIQELSELKKMVSQMEPVSDRQVLKAINTPRPDHRDLWCLLSETAGKHLEAMAQRAHDITRSHFGKSVVLYTPMYLSNHCTNSCVYCGFNRHNKIGRKRLTLTEVESEAAAIAAKGFRHILILTGDDPKRSSVQYLSECCSILKKYFKSISMEIYALEESDYKTLADAGINGLTIYQETYDEALYKTLHPSGPKRDFKFRLGAPERGCNAGIRNLNIGSLLGLSDFRKDSFFTAMHALKMQSLYPHVDMNISLPRMRPHAGEFQPEFPVGDREMVQILTAIRIFMPRCGINISTRESSDFRDNILKLGITHMSGDSKTSVGGHAGGDNNTGQFEISDGRSISQICEMLKKQGYQPVFKDWEPFA